MDTERAEGIVLHLRPVTETSLLVTWFTREFGKLKTLAKGARRPKSPFRGTIDLFYEDEIVFLRSRRSDLHLLQECFLEKAHRSLRERMAAVVAASYACELVDVVTAIEDVHPAMYDLLAWVLRMLEKSVGRVPLIWFELQVLAAAGWRPSFAGGSGTGKVLQSLTKVSAAGVLRVRLTDAQAAAAQTEVWRFREEHIGRAMRSQELLAAKFGH